MSASESSPLTSNLQESIEHLIAETVRNSQSSHEEEKQQLRVALQTALAEIEAGQASLNRAADTIRAALGTPATVSATIDVADDVVDEAPAPPEVIAVEPPKVLPAEIGPHQMDVIAHDVTIGIASSLQSLLRERPEVTNAQTREFVNGELRLKLDLASGLDMSVLDEWIAAHSGRITSSTASVLELRFDD